MTVLLDAASPLLIAIPILLILVIVALVGAAIYFIVRAIKKKK